jgi:hypothetical protein
MPSRSRRRSRQQGSASSSTGAESQQQGARQGAPSTGVRGWLAGAGRWVSDKYEATTDAVGDFVHKTGQAASELWDVSTNSDLSLEGGNLVLNTDLDELMDVMPASVAGALQLDREASANRVRVVIDPGEKVAVLTSDEITVAGVNSESLKTGSVRLQGVRIRLSNPGGGVPFLDGDFGFLGFKDADDNLTAEVEVAGLTASDVVVQGADGPTTLASLQVDGLTGTAAAQGGAPMGEGAKTTLDFSVEGAVMEGLARQGITVAKATATGASGGMYEGSETAFLAADQLAISGATQDGTALGGAQVSGARVDVKNQGGGLVGLDDKADRLSGRVRVDTASVQDFDGQSADLQSGALGGVQVDFDSVAGTARAEAQTAQLQGLDTTSLDVDQASLRGFGADLGMGEDQTTLRAAAEQARVSGVRFDGDASTPAAGGGDSMNLDWGVDIADLGVTDIEAAGASLAGVQGQNLQASGLASGDASWFMARADQAGLDGLDHDLLRARQATLGGAGLDWHAGGDTNLRARDVSVTDAAAHNFSAGGLQASGGAVTLGPTGDARASLAHGSVTDATIADRVSVASGQVQGVTASARDGQRQVGIESASASGIRDSVTGGTLGSASLSGVQTGGDGSRFSTTVDEARLANGAVSGHRLGDATARGLSVSRDGGGALTGGFDGLQATGLHGATGGNGVDIGALDARNGQATMGTNGFGSGSLDQLSTTGLRSDQGSAATASVRGISASRDASGVRATADSGQAGDIRMAGGGRIDALHTEGVSAIHGNGRSQLGVRSAEATGVTASGVSAESVAVQGGLVDHTAGSEGALSGTYRRGDRGPGVARLQTLLAGRGHDVGTPDGAFGPGTERALIAFQQSAGLTPDGVAGSGTLGALQGGTGPASTQARFDGLQASTVAVDRGGTQASMGSVDASGGRARFGPGGPAASLDQLSVRDARVASAGGAGGGSGVDSSALLGSASRLVDDADIRGSVGLNPGKAGPLEVKRGTTASGRVSIQDNHVDQRNTRVDLSRPLDGPLWTSVSGVRSGRDGQLKADVNGWFDQDLAPKVNDSLGLQGDRLHSVSAMGTAAARQQGGGSSDGPGLVDTDSLQLQGDASFNAGTLDAGQAGSLTLDQRQSADQNKVSFSSDGRGQVVAGVADLLSRGFSTSTDAGSLSGGASRVQDARVQTGPDGTNASASRLDARDLQLGGGVPAGR